MNSPVVAIRKGRLSPDGPLTPQACSCSGYHSHIQGDSFFPTNIILKLGQDLPPVGWNLTT